jgi:hypothetical protein
LQLRANHRFLRLKQGNAALPNPCNDHSEDQDQHPEQQPCIEWQKWKKKHHILTQRSAQKGKRTHKQTKLVVSINFVFTCAI